jgi:hypothetical protein
MAWKAYLMNAQETDEGAEVMVEFRDLAADLITIERAVSRTYKFPLAEPLTKATLKARVQPDLDGFNNKETAVAQIQLNIGADIMTL